MACRRRPASAKFTAHWVEAVSPADACRSAFPRNAAERGSRFFGEVDAEEKSRMRTASPASPRSLAAARRGVRRLISSCRRHRGPVACRSHGTGRPSGSQHEAVVEFDADDGIAADFTVSPALPAGGAWRQSEQRLRATDAAAADFQPGRAA